MKITFTHLFATIAAISVLVGCTEKFDNKAENTTPGVVWKAQLDGTKTVLNDVTVEWESTDAIVLFGEAQGSPEKGRYTATNIDGSYAEFIYASGYEFQTGEAQYALYPYAEDALIDGSQITLALSETQAYRENSFGRDANAAVGVVNGEDIYFRNICGCLELKLKAESGTVELSRIVLTTKGDENLWGTFTCDVLNTTDPVAEYSTGGGKSIVLDCSGVSIGDTEKDFYISVPAGSLSKGFVAEVYSAKGHLVTTMSTSKDNTIARRDIKEMPLKSFKWIPSGYSELELIQSTGNQYIKTGYIDNDETAKFEADCRYTSLESSNSYIAGCSDGSKWLLMGVQDKKFKFQADGNQIWDNSADKDRHIFSIDLNNGEARIDGNKIGTETGAGTPNRNELYLFARNNNGKDECKCTACLYSFKIYNGGKVSHYFVPCRNSSNEIGLYDLNTGKFLKNSGTGKFVTLVSYIQSNATQYINTGYKPTRTDVKYVADCQYVKLTGSGDFKNVYVAGTATKVDNTEYWVLIGAQDGKFKYQAGVTGTETKPWNSDTNRHTFTLDVKNKKVGCDSNTTSLSEVSACNADLYLFARKGLDGKLECPAHLRLYSFKIYEGEKLVHDYRPALNDAGTPGLYDVVTSAFLKKVAGDELTYGY